MAVNEKIKSHPDLVGYFKELPFYNKYIEKLRVKRLKTLICFLNFFLWRIECNKDNSSIFYEELNVIKTIHPFRRHAMSYKVELIEKKDPIEQLEASKSSFKDLLSNL